MERLDDLLERREKTNKLELNAMKKSHKRVRTITILSFIPQLLNIISMTFMFHNIDHSVQGWYMYALTCIVQISFIMFVWFALIVDKLYKRDLRMHTKDLKGK